MRRIDRAAQMFERSRGGALGRRAGLWSGVLVLNYHRIGAPRPGFDAELWSATPQELDRQFALLARDFEVVGPGDLAERPAARGRRVLITFDDGYRDNHEHALGVLSRHGLTATFFVVPGFIDRPRIPWWDEIAWMAGDAAPELVARYKELPASETEGFLDSLGDRFGTGRRPPTDAADLWMTWDHVRELAAAGMTIGGHSLNHPVLARLSRDEQEAEIAGCAARLRDELGLEMRWFSYPVGLPGTYDATTRELLADARVELAFAFAGGYSAGGIGADRLAIPRTGVSYGMTHERFAATVTLPRVFARW